MTATDADSDAIVYRLGGDDASKFDLDPLTGQITRKPDTLEGTYSMTVTATAMGGSDEIAVRVTIGNTAPVLADGPLSFFEYSNNTNVCLPVTATDTDSDDTLTYSLSGTHASDFSIGSSSGQIFRKSLTGVGTYQVVVEVFDGAGGSDSVA